MKYLLFTIMAISFIGCLGDNQSLVNSDANNEKQINDGYDERISNINAFLTTANVIRDDSCYLIFLLQSSKCDVCTTKDLDFVKQEFSGRERKIFILTEYNAEIIGFIKKNNSTDILLVDEDRKLPRLGLLFMKNVQIEYCRGKVESWQFLESMES